MKHRLPRSLLFFVPGIFGLVTGWPLMLLPLLPLPPDQLRLVLTSFFALFLACVSFALPWLGLLGIVLEVRRGKVHRSWLAPVIAVFVGYYAVFAWDSLRYARERHERAEANAAMRVDFDPTRQALVAPLFPAGEMVRNYGLPVAYIGNPLDHSAQLLSRRYIDDALCQELEARLPERLTRIQLYRPKPWQQEPCLLTMPEVPELPVVRVGPPPVGSAGRGADHSDRGYMIELPGGAPPVILRDPAPGWLPLPWWPDLGAVCNRLFGSRAGAVGCVSLDWRQEWHAGPNSLDALAAALGLEKPGPEGRVLADPDLVRRKFDVALAGLKAGQPREAKPARD